MTKSHYSHYSHYSYFALPQIEIMGVIRNFEFSILIRNFDGLILRN